MDSQRFNERVKKLQELNKVITQLDPAIREQAFALLKSYVTGSQVDEEVPDNGQNGADEVTQSSVDTDDAAAFFSKHPDGKPSDNALVCAAYLYGQYGAAPFSAADLRAVGDSAGLTLPERLDMTLRQARRENKALFQKVGKDQFKPTVHGEQFLKSAYSVKKGSKQRSASAE
jgi:hypothetical protein